MPPPWAEGPTKVVVEFLKSGEGAKRLITLKHNAAVVPPQLNGRINPAVWGGFMTDIQQAAQQHPYVVTPSAGRVGSWVLGGAMGAVFGCCFVNPDGGDYETWLPQVQALIDRHQPAFSAAGCRLSLQRAQNSHWVQIDIDPNMAMGQPVAAPPGTHQPYPQQPQQPYPYQQPPQQAKPGYEPMPGAGEKPGYEAKPAGYP